MARLDVNIVTSLVGAGLEREALLLKDLFSKHDIYANLIHYTRFEGLVRADITIFMEVVMPQALALAKENWLIPNSEWWHPVNDRFLPHFSKILCKTTDCYDIWSRKVDASKCVFTSFEARDIYNPEVPRELRCLHVAGKSEHKNTEAVVRAWRITQLPHMPKLPELTVIARAPIFQSLFEVEFPYNNVKWIPHASDAQILEFMNSHQIHVIPSMYEGFGHALQEGIGCGALVLTTDAAPMNTFAGIFRPGLIPSQRQEPRCLAQMHTVLPQSVEASVRKAMDICWKPEMYARYSQQARTGFLANREFFRAKVMELVNGFRR